MKTALELAIKFHETYERLAPSFGYETRTETRAFDPDSLNGRLMVAVCNELTRTGQIVPRETVAGVVHCLGFFSSVIKSGEPWTATCEREYRAALARARGEAA